MADRDLFANAPDLIERVYAYVAYRIGEGPDAEDVTSDVFERALRYRKSYNPSRGGPLTWLIGIARRCIDDELQRPRTEPPDDSDSASPEDLEAEALQRLTVAAAMQELDERSRDLVALRFGADLSAKQIGEILEMKTNAVEVALHRTLARLKPNLERVAKRSSEKAQICGSDKASEASKRASGWA